MNGKLKAMALALGGVAAGTALYARLVEPRLVYRTHTRLHFRDLRPALEGLRIALLTDLHASPTTPRGLLRRVVRKTLAVQPDIIAVAGDLAETEAALEVVLDELASLRAPLGVFVVPGNHDYRDVGIERWHDAVARRPTLVDLTNRCRTVSVSRAPGPEATARLCIAGVDDLAHGRPRLDFLPPLEQRDFTLLLAHHPDQAERARRALDSVDLIVSGHTHAGQVRLPFLGAVINSAEHPELYEAGVRRRPWTQVYTSRGIGTTHLPVRFLAPPEIAVLELTAAPRPGRAGAR
ncbi:MAG TPA: metallophosphoesterase [Longimicrobiales bacterium]|nr:metallophosphoesterase [Longimicrobiales bacterium]